MQQIHYYHSERGSLHPAVVIKKPEGKNYKKRVLWLIGSLAVFRLLLSTMLQLGNDEAYYWLYSQDLKLNYFDHPSMVAIWIRLFTANLTLQDYEVFLRLGSVVSCGIATWAIYKTVSIIHSSRAGWFAAVLYNASFYAGLTAGLYIMPDSPQMVFWTLGMWAIAKISAEEWGWKAWILLGVATGLCIMSKVHGAFIPLGVGLFVLLHKREWLLKPQPYVALVIAAIIASPILIWNIKNDFITYQFHTERVTIENTTFDFVSFLSEVASQLFFNNPINTALIFIALFQWRKMDIGRWPALRVYNFIGLPFAVLLLFISLFRDTTLPHWSGPAYVSLLPMAAVYLARKNRTEILPVGTKWSLGIFVGVLVAWVGIVHFYPGTWGKKQQSNFGQYDISLDLYGWKEASKEFIALYNDDVARGIVPAKTPLVCTYWWGAHVEYYFCKPYNLQMFGLGSIHNIREYWWMNKKRSDSIRPENAYCIMPVDENYTLPTAFYKEVELAKVIEIKRGGLPAHIFNVYRLKGWKGDTHLKSTAVVLR